MSLLSEYHWRYSCFLAQFLTSFFSSTGKWWQAQSPALPGASLWACKKRSSSFAWSFSFCMLKAFSCKDLGFWYLVLPGVWVLLSGRLSSKQRYSARGFSSLEAMCPRGFLLLPAVEFKKSVSLRILVSSPCLLLLLLFYWENWLQQILELKLPLMFWCLWSLGC